MKNKIQELEYACFICNKRVKRSGFDISAVVLITNWENQKKQRSQQFFCHIDCFKGIAHDKFKSEFYILDEKFKSK